MSDINVASNQYVVLNDWIFSSSNAVDAPEWLVTLIDNVVSSLIASNFTDYNLLVEEVRNAIDSLNVAQNSFDQYWNLESLIDGIVLTYVQTLNASIQDSQAQIVNLQQAIATTEFSLAQAVQDITANYQDYADARATEITTAFANADAALASSIQALTTVYEDQQTDLEGFANAVEALESYVGITGDGSTGLLGTVNTLKEQTDGIIEYYFLESYDDPAGFNGDSNFFLTATDEASALALILAVWETVELKNAAHGNIVYFKDSTNAYSYNSSNNAWYPVSDTNLYEAVKAAADAQATADGKVSQYYAWENVSANGPVNTSYGDPLVTISGSSWKFWYQPDTENLYYWDGSTWLEVTNAFDGDMLTTFDPVALDYSFYTYNEATGEWVPTSPRGIVANSKWAIDLESEVSAFPEQWASADSVLQNTVESYADAQRAAVEAKFEYGSILEIDGEFYQSGFGLVSSGSATYNEEGSQIDPFDSEFWINAERFVLKSPTYPDVSAVFNVTASGIQLGIEHTEATRNVAAGVHDPNSAYTRGDIVTSDGSSYVAIINVPANTNILVTNTTYWQLLAEAGILGQSVDYWFKRFTTVPTDTPAANGANANNWYTDLSDVSADDTIGDLYVIKGTKAGNSENWVYDDPVLLSAKNVKELIIYSDVVTGNAPAVPTDSTYNFKTGTLTLGSTGASWNKSLPAIANDLEKIYVATALVTGNETETSVAISWDAPTLYASRVDGYTPQKGVDYDDGVDGNNVRVEYSADNSSWHLNLQAGDLYIRTAVDTNGDGNYVAGPSTKFVPEKGVEYDDGDPGVSSYLHIKYSDDGINFTGNNGEDVGTWIGTYVDNTENDSNTFSDYTWRRYVGTDGADGLSAYEIWLNEGNTGTLTDYLTSLIGADGADGSDGLPGQDGVDGITLYTWIKYADNADGTSGFSNNPANKPYIGISYNNTSATESNNPADYSWSLIKGSDGYTPVKGVDYFDGLPGADGADGDNAYQIWLSEGNTGSTTDFINALRGADGADGSDGLPGTDGADGTTYYTWVKYADSADGTVGFSNNPSGKPYIGFAFNKTTATESTNAADYTWSLIKGADGQDGQDGYTPVKGVDYFDGVNGTDGADGDSAYQIWLSEGNSGSTSDFIAALRGADGADGSDGLPGVDGTDGTTYYTWVKYADNATGTVGFSNVPTGKAYIGFAFNKTTATESNNASDYTWSLIKGADGADGANGTNGADGADGARGIAVLHYSYLDGTAAYDINNLASSTVYAFWNNAAPSQLDNNAVAGDSIILTNRSTNQYGGTNIYKFDGSSWSSSTAFKVNGDAVISGTLSANVLAGGTIIASSLGTGTAPSNGTIIDANGIRIRNNGVSRVKLGNLSALT